MQWIVYSFGLLIRECSSETNSTGFYVEITAMFNKLHLLTLIDSYRYTGYFLALGLGYYKFIFLNMLFFVTIWYDLLLLQ